MIWSFADLLALARLSDIAYGDDTREPVTALGMTWAGQVGNGECQATVAGWGGYAVTAIRGTSVGINTSLSEIWCDLDWNTYRTAGGGLVSAGFWGPLSRLWPQIRAIMPPGQPVVTGHSLGGVRAHLAAALWPEAEVVSFGAPRGANVRAWREMFPGRRPTRVVHAQDFAPEWAPIGGDEWGCTQPGPMLWLENGSAAAVVRRPGLCLSIADHMIDTGYIPALEALARAQIVSGQDSFRYQTAENL